jgi:hypothetical protein
MRWIKHVIVFCFGCLLWLLAVFIPDFSTWYAVNIFPILQNTIGRFWNLFPFLAYEVILIIVCICVLVCIAIIIADLCASKWRKKFFNVKRFDELVVGIILCFFIMNILTIRVNSSRESFYKHLGIQVGSYSSYELVQLAALLIREAKEMVDMVTTDKNGHFILQNKATLYDDSIHALQTIHSMYGGLSEFFPRPKRTMFPRLIANRGAFGYWSFFTMEVVYNGEMLDIDKPFTILHELAHSAGYIDEDDADFIAFLAGFYSENNCIRYSTLVAALDILLGVNFELDDYFPFDVPIMPEQMIRDLDNRYEHWHSNVGIFREIASFFRRNTEQHKVERTEAVDSIERIVNMMIAYFVKHEQIMPK